MVYLFCKIKAYYGDPEGQYEVARCYFHGEGIDKSRELYFHYLKLSSENGIGTDKSHEKAMYYYNLCANEEKEKKIDEPSFYNMLGFEKAFRNLQETFVYYKSKAIMGDQDSILKLAAFYEKEQSEFPLHNFLLAAALGDPITLKNIDKVETICEKIYSNIKEIDIRRRLQKKPNGFFCK